MSDAADRIIRTADLKREAAVHIRHPLNEKSDMRYHPLADAAGLKRTGVGLGRIPPGKESFCFHAHTVIEEWVFILSGSGTAEIGEERIAVGAGDFIAYPTDGVGHNLINSGDVDLVYLMGGEKAEVDIGAFPRLGKYILSMGGGKFAFIDEDALAMKSLDDFVARD